MFSHYRYKQYGMNKREQETPFPEKNIEFRPHIVYIQGDEKICKKFKSK